MRIRWIIYSVNFVSGSNLFISILFSVRYLFYPNAPRFIKVRDFYAGVYYSPGLAMPAISIPSLGSCKVNKIAQPVVHSADIKVSYIHSGIIFL